MPGPTIRVTFFVEEDDEAVTRECSFVPNIGDVVDFPLVPGSTKSPMMGYKVVEKRWVVPVEGRDMHVLLKLEPYEAVFRKHYVETARLAALATEARDGG